MKRIFIWVGVCVFFLALLGGGYLWFSKEETVQEEQVVKFLIPYSTSHASARSVYAGVDLALAEMGGYAGKYLIELVRVEISNTEVPAAFDDVKKIPSIIEHLDDPALLASIGPIASPVHIAIAPLLNRARVAQMGFSVTYTGLSKPNYASADEYRNLFPTGELTFFSMTANGERQSQVAVEFAWRRGANSLMLLSDGIAFGEGIVKSAGEYAATKQMTTIRYSLPEFASSTKNFDEIFATRPDAIIVGSFGSPRLFEFVNAAREYGYTGDIIGPSFSGTIENPGTFIHTENIFSVDPLPDQEDLVSVRAKEFERNYFEAYGEKPASRFTLAGYEAASLVFRIAAETGPDKTKFLNALRTVRSINTAYGLVAFNEYGAPRDPVLYISRLQDKKWVFEQEME